MKVTGIAVVPPELAENNLRATPELLASCLARYSRSNHGIEEIFKSIDWDNQEESIERIFRFIDYGHASIGGLTSGIAIAIDGCSMWLAYKLFEIAQYCDGQESSTRYIDMNSADFVDPKLLGVPDKLEDAWRNHMLRAKGSYHRVCRLLQARLDSNPELLEVPEGTSPKVRTRLERNYVFDRARYLLPCAIKTNAAYVMTARAWADALRQLDALPWPEASLVATKIRKELGKFAPRLIKHSSPDWAARDAAFWFAVHLRDYIGVNGASNKVLSDEVFVGIESATPHFLPDERTLEQSSRAREGRYSVFGIPVRRINVRAAWNNIAIADLRDMNRHRTGFRYSPLYPVGFYLPEEVREFDVEGLLAENSKLIERFNALCSIGEAVPIGAYLLGTQVPFEHSTQLDKLIYMIELRTGAGAHFRYAEHFRLLARELCRAKPELSEIIDVGENQQELL